MGRMAPTIILPDPVREILEGMRRSRSLPQHLAERVRFILRSADGELCTAQAQDFDVDPQRVRRWRTRWAQGSDRLTQAVREGAAGAELKHLVLELLADNYRCGVTPKFSAEQVAAIIALGCEDPGEHGLPVSHWTPRELAAKAKERGIVKEISPRQVGRFLNEAQLRPHMSRYWLNPKPADPQEFQNQVGAVCATYLNAPALEAAGTHVISSDEKTGMQALERTAPTKPARPGQVERREFEYERHGTLCLTANFNVATGKVQSPTLQETRNEEDFAANVQRVIDTDPDAGWIFVVDNLNTHCSESLVYVVAKACDIKGDLGVKGKRGVLASMESRVAFLSDPTHRVRFVYTPKHCSWLNQVEIWFGILVRRLLRRASFKSLEDLRQRVLAFISYFNAVLAKPFKWTYTGRQLKA